MTTPTSDQRLLARLFLAGLALAAALSAALAVAPAEARLVPCPARLVTGIACPGCGMTRACLALARGRLEEAWSLHPFAYFLVPLALAVAFAPQASTGLWRILPRASRRTLVGSLALLGLWNWLA